MHLIIWLLVGYPAVKFLKAARVRRLRGFLCVLACMHECVWVKVSSPAQFLFLFLFPLAQVLISQPRDQRRSLAISQREPLIPHRSTRDTAAPWTPREAPQSSSRASRERERERRNKRKRKREVEQCVCVCACVCIFLLARAEATRAFSLPRDMKQWGSSRF